MGAVRSDERVPPLPAPVLVTGAAGFIGRHLVARLVAGKTPVRALVLPGEHIRGVDAADLTLVEGDVADGATVEAAVDGCQTVIHLAAVVADWGARVDHLRVTVGGTHNVLVSAARHGSRAVIVSSLVVYGDALARDVCDEEHPMGRPMGVYGDAKQEQERVAWRFIGEGRGPVTIVRPTNVYGPGSGPWVGESARALRRGLPVLIGGGDLDAALCHVENLVDLLLRAAASPSAVGRAYNAADGSGVTWRRYFTDLARLLGAPPPRAMPRGLARLCATAVEAVWSLARIRGRPPLTHEALNLVGSNLRVPIDRARRELGYEPGVSYETGMAALAAHVAGGTAA